MVAAAGGWLPQKLRAWAETAGVRCRGCCGERRRIQATRRISAGEFAAGLTPALDSPYLGRAGRSRALGLVLGAYWALVRRLLGGG